MENLEKDDLLFVTVFKSKNDQDIYLLFPKIFFKDYNKKRYNLAILYWPNGLPNHGKFLGQVKPHR